jgi:hypothetical protein
MNSKKTTILDGQMTSGVIIRHLILPLCISDSISVVEWFKNNAVNGAYLSLMSQYTPIKNFEKTPELNRPITSKEYQKVLDNLNNRAYPLFTMNKISIRLKNNKTFIIMEYNFPLSPMKNDKKFVVSTDFKVVENKIIADNINISSLYGALQHNKIANLINGLDPLSYTLTVLNTKKCNAKVENVKIIDNLVEIDGKIFVEGD